MPAGTTRVIRRIDPSRRGADSPWMTVKEGAAYLRVGVDTIYEACASRGMKHSKFGHSTIRLQRAWLDAWAEAQIRQQP